MRFLFEVVEEGLKLGQRVRVVFLVQIGRGAKGADQLFQYAAPELHPTGIAERGAAAFRQHAHLDGREGQPPAGRQSVALRQLGQSGLHLVWLRDQGRKVIHRASLLEKILRGYTCGAGTARLEIWPVLW